MKRRTFMMGMSATLLTPHIARAQSKAVVTVAQAADPALEAALWAAMNGKVTSDTVDLRVDLVSIPATIQAISTQQYDIVVAVMHLLPRLAQQGVPVRIVSSCFRYSKNGGGSRLWVMADGPKTPEDLKGKKIGVSSLASSGVTNNRIMLSELFGSNVALDGGDFTWVEIPTATLPAALEGGQVDAVVLSNTQDYAASQDTRKRVLIDTNGEMRKAFDVQVPGTVMVSYEDRLEARKAEFLEANRLLAASVEYLNNNRDEVFAAIAEKAKIKAEYLKWYYEFYADAAYDFVPSDLVAIGKYWEAAKKAGVIEDYPAPETLLWEEVKFG